MLSYVIIMQRPFPIASPIAGVYTEEPLNFGMGLKDELSPYVGHMLHGCVERMVSMYICYMCVY